MTSRDFCFWLQGFFELRGDKTVPPNIWQTDEIQKHLNLVFIHETALLPSNDSDTKILEGMKPFTDAQIC